MSKITGSVGRIGAGLILRPVVGIAKKQWARRGAEDLTELRIASVEAEVAEALRVLSGEADSAGGAVWNWVKQQLSDPPAIFDDPEAKEWLRRDEVKSLIKRAAVAVAGEQPLDEMIEEAKRLYGEGGQGDDWYGAPLFTYAVAFVSLTLYSALTPGDRMLLQVENERSRRDSAILQGVDEKVGRLLAQTSAPSVPIDAVDQFVLHEVSIRRRSQLIANPDEVKDAVALGQRAADGDLAHATAPVKIELFRLVAATLARDGDPDGATCWLDLAAGCGGTGLEPDQARLALVAGNYDEALRLLAGRDDPQSKSLLVDLVRRRDGKAAAISYFREYESAAGVTGLLLCLLAHWMMEQDEYESAAHLLHEATPDQIADNPVLLFTRMRVELGLLTPAGQRASLLQSPSLLPPPLTLRNDGEGGRLRQSCLADLRNLIPILVELRAPNLLSLVELFEQYFALASLDSDEAAAAETQLAQRLRDPATVMDFVPLARIFGVDFDRAGLRTQLERAERLGPWTDAQLRAAFDLTIGGSDSEAISQFVDQHRDRLIEVVGPGPAIGLQVEALARAGRLTDARAKFELSKDILLPSDLALLTDIIAEGEGASSLDLHEARFRLSDDDRDLDLLVQALHTAGDARLPAFALDLWRRRHRVEDAINVANALMHFGKAGELRAFFDELGEEADSDPRLQAQKAWMLFQEGELVASSTLVTSLRRTAPDESGIRQLAINLAIESGDWQALGPIARSDLDARDRRTPQQLVQAAGLSHAIGSPDARDLILAAVQKADGDPQILVSAFDLSVRLGDDGSEEPTNWLVQAIAASGDDGPIRSAPLRELIDLRKASMEAVNRADRLVLEGQVPLAMAVKGLGTTLSALMLGRVAENPRLKRVRERVCLPFFAGNRNPFDLAGIKCVALDPTAILNLHILGLLETALEAFDEVIIPAGTLPALFEDLIGAQRNQPSRSKRADEVKTLIASGAISIVDEESGDDARDDADVLYAAAEKADGFVVDSPPLYVPGSLGEEIRDPAPFASRLVSMHSLLIQLKRRGEITDLEQEVAERIPSFNKSWPDEIQLDLDRPLFFESASLGELAEAGVLVATLRAANAVYVRRRVLEMADLEVAQDRNTAVLRDGIEAVRATLSGALRRGRARAGPFRSNDADSLDRKGSRWSDPLVATLKDAAGAEILVSDDRMINQHAFFTDANDVARPVATSLDVLDLLRDQSRISPAQHGAALMRLRTGGGASIPISAEEISSAAERGDWNKGPGRELRAIRDSIHLPLLRRAVILPAEQHWLETAVFGLCVSIKRCFRDMQDTDQARAAAEFLFNILPDLRGYTAGEGGADAKAWAANIVAGAHGLLAIPLDIPTERIGLYEDWYSETPLERLRGRDSDVLEEIVARLKMVILADRDVDDFEDGVTQQDVKRWVVGHCPRFFRDKLLDDPEVLSGLGYEPSGVLKLPNARVARSALVSLLEAAMLEPVTTLRSIDGNILSVSTRLTDAGAIAMEGDTGSTEFVGAGVLSADRAIRETALKSLLSIRTLSASNEAMWSALVRERAATTDEYGTLMERLRNTPEAFAIDAHQKLNSPDAEFQELVPEEDEYFSTLVELGQLEDFGTAIASFTAERRTSIAPRAAALATAPAFILLSPELREWFQEVDRQDEELLGLLVAEDDPFSLLLALELACCDGDRLIGERREMADAVVASFLDDPDELNRRAHIFCAAATVTYGLVRSRGQLGDWSLAARRTAIFSHAGHMYRALAQFEIAHEELFERTQAWKGSAFGFAGLMERGIADGWQLRWLSPKAIGAYFLKRCEQAIERLPEDQRPGAWQTSLKEAFARFEAEGSTILFGLPGPVDEFVAEAPLTRTISEEEYRVVLDLIDKLSGTGLANALFVVRVQYGPPDGLALDPLIEAIETKLAEETGDAWDHLFDMAVDLSVAWRSPSLADALLRIARQSDRSHLQLVEQALAAASSHADAENRSAALKRMIEDIAFSDPEPAQAAGVARTIEAISNLDPSMSAPLGLARLAAVLSL